ncbi:hypothetical protein B7435_30315 [Mycolicibacterium peregrinum]|nr:hypothetical protein B7435_30315 [Mycolicibacterium peregrinum]
MTTVLAATSVAESLPPASIVLLAAAAAVWVVGFAVNLATSSAEVERRAFWAGYLGVGALAALAFLFSGWFTSVLVFVMVAVTTLSHAYFRTSYLVLGGRIITATRHER